MTQLRELKSDQQNTWVVAVKYLSGTARECRGERQA